MNTLVISTISHRIQPLIRPHPVKLGFAGDIWIFIGSFMNHNPNMDLYWDKGHLTNMVIFLMGFCHGAEGTMV